ncbi:MAG: histidine kinase [Ferruginibacter sp.]
MPVIRTSFVIFFVLSFIASSAQQHEIDSLNKVLKTHTTEDTIRLHALNDISYSYYQLNPTEGLKFAEEAIILAKKLNNGLLLLEAYYNKGINYQAKSDYGNSLEMFRQAEAVFGNNTDKSKLFAIRNSMAVDYMDMSNYPEALKIYFENLALAEKLKKKLGIGTSCQNISIVYRYLKNNKKSLEFQFRAISMFRDLGRNRSLADAYSSLGNTYDNIDKVDSALFFYKQSVEISEKYDYPKGVAGALTNMGIVYIKTRDYSKALDCLNKALAIYTEMDDQNNMAIIFSNMGEVIYKAPDSILKKINIAPANKSKTAIDYYKKSLQLSENTEDIASQVDEWESLSKIYKDQKNYEQSLIAYEKFIVLKDSIINDEKKQAITKIEMQFEFTKQEDSLKAEHEKKEIISRAEIARQETVKESIVAGSLILLAAGIAGFIFYKRNRDIRQQHKDAELKNEITETNMKVMRLQMNPHFIFNSLNSIGDYIIKNKPGEADAYLAKFAKVMRMTLENSEKKEITLADDLLMLELYMQLEAKRLNDKFSYKINIGPGVDTENILVPPMIFQPFVENSIWHGIAKKEGKGHIDISISGINGMLHCVIEDDGVGRQQPSTTQPNEQAKNASLGMKITKARIEILNKLKGSNATVQLIDKPQGLRAELQLPSESKF